MYQNGLKLKFHSCHLIMKSLFTAQTIVFYCVQLTLSSEESTLKENFCVSYGDGKYVGGGLCVFVVAIGKEDHSWKVFPLGSMNLILQVMNFAEVNANQIANYWCLVLKSNIGNSG